jgi:oxygen-independent coproporphyrinogen-3 oxidase
MILQLKRGYLDVEYFQSKFATDIVSRWKSNWDQYVADGFVKYTPNRIELTMDGLLRVDALLPVFFEPEHQNVRYT